LWQTIKTIFRGEKGEMKKKISGMMLIFLSITMLTLTSNICSVKAHPYIRIMSDGSIDPPDAPIQRDGNIYTLTGNIQSDEDGIVVERSNIMIDGNRYALQSSMSGSGTGISLTGRKNVTIKNMNIKNYEYGIDLSSSSNYNSISGNNITNNGCGIELDYSSNNRVFHNNFINNAQQVYSSNSVNVWDDGYPSCGNYWSDYTGVDLYSGPYQNETDRDGIGDTQYVIDSNNIDHYPLMNAWTPNFAVPSQMVVGYATGPSTIDPARCYDTTSWELILNVYETLVFFDKEKISQFVPRLATQWNISEDGLTYNFVLRQGVKFHNNETLTTEDVEYSLERLLVIEGGPAWMFYEAFFDTYGSHDSQGNLIVTGQQIDDAITHNETTVTLHLAKCYPPLMQALSQCFASVLCKNWCVGIGDWPGTWNNWLNYNRPATTAIEVQNTAPPGPHLNAICGTGPYMFEYYEDNVEWAIFKSDLYWGGWPAPSANSYVKRVVAKIIGDWETRKNMFLAGQLDYTTVPRWLTSEVLGQPGITCIYPLPTLTCSSLFFTFNIPTTSPWLGIPGGLPEGTFNESGIPYTFFNDVMVRRGFAYAINYTGLIKELYLGEAYQPATAIIPGLPFCNIGQEKYELDLTKAEERFRNSWGGQLWAKGFSFTIPYWDDSMSQKRIFETIEANVESLNPKFHIQLQPLPWGQYSLYRDNHENPMFIYGWLADFADPHNFAFPFMYSQGFFTNLQNYCNETIDTLVREGINTMNYTERKETYYELQRVYHEDCPNVPLFQPRDRRFQRDWVQGWFYNTLLGEANYYYTQWKQQIPPHVIEPGQNTVNAIPQSDTIVFMNTTSQGNVTISSYDINLEGTIAEGLEVNYVKCVTIETTTPPEDIIFPIEVRVYFTDQEVISAYVGDSDLKMYYWNGTNWLLENNTGVVIPSDVSGYKGYVWAKIYHLSLFALVGPLPKHDVATIGVVPSKTAIGQGYTTSFNFTFENQGNCLEIFNITIYANTTIIGTLAFNMTGGNSKLVNFVWNTTGFAEGNYTISAVADTVPGEIDILDNRLTDGWILITKVGDLNLDGIINYKDASLFRLAYIGAYSYLADFNQDEVINYKDASLFRTYYVTG
jgi:peptide/nickel transport system substrate-binding protein